MALEGPFFGICCFQFVRASFFNTSGCKKANVANILLDFNDVSVCLQMLETVAIIFVFNPLN